VKYAKEPVNIYWDQEIKMLDTQVPSHCRNLCLVPGRSMWVLWWIRWHWDMVFFEYFGSPCQNHSISASFHSFICR